MDKRHRILNSIGVGSIGRAWKVLIGAGVIGTAMLASTLTATAQQAPTGLPANLFERALPAAQALVKVGNRLATIAERNPDLPAADLQRLFADRTTWVDPTGRIFVIETANAQVGPSDPVISNTYDLAKTFLLESRPGAPRTIFLDFKGGSVSGSSWSSYAGVTGAISAEAFDTDGLPLSFSNNELNAIQSIWMRVAEDYAPFDVNVTTRDLGFAAVNRADSTDQYYGTRVLLTTRNNPVYVKCTCGGVAYMGVFDDMGTNHTYYQPAWVFNTGTKAAAEAASHEAGHNLGLGHDGTATLGYYSGQGSWAPIMGTGYSVPVVQWSKGEYTGANNTQDDFVVMASNGLPLAADDHSNTAVGATVLTDPAFSIDGLISSRTDADVFQISAGAGVLSLSVTPSPVSPNLDVLLELRNSAGTLVASSNPATVTSNQDIATGLSASLSVTVPAGVYTARIDGVGDGDPATTGYSDYASLGRYRFSGSVPVSTTGSAPVASAAASVTSGVAPLPVNFTGSATDADNNIASYQWNFGDGSSSPLQSPSHTYGSAGTFTAQLIVTDTTGLTGTASVVITVAAAPVVPTAIDVSSVTSTGTNNKQGATATATVTVSSRTGPAAGATVTGTWTLTRSTGTTTLGTSTALTGSTGTATTSSPRVTAVAGDLLNYCMTNVVAPAGSAYDPGLSTAATCTTWMVTALPGGKK